MRQISDITGFLEHPVKGVSATFAILYILSGVVHIWQSRKYKSWHFTWFIPCACVIFAAGFICREYTAYFPTSEVFPAMQGLLYSAPPIVAAALYVFLPCLLPNYQAVMPIRPAHLTAIAIGLTFSAIISLTAQGTSQFFSPETTDSMINSSLAVLKASLISQLFLNFAFVAIIIIFHRRCSSKGIFMLRGEQKTRSTSIISPVYIFITLVMVRDLFRTVQIFLPSASPAWTVEAYFWLFDAMPMLIYTLLLNFRHPARYFYVPGDTCAASPPPELDSDCETAVAWTDHNTLKLRTVQVT